MFDIPVTLFFMKRTENTLKVLSGIAKVKPKKLYLISDGGRTEEEHEKVKACRAAVEAAVNWDCEIVRDYAETNVGILDRIGFGAKRVLEKEEYAIFLEDDNYPEESFFYFCREMLLKYRDNTNILWVCGTNYLEEYDSPYSYVFTRHTLPCGWASWGHKFPKVYDGYLEGLDDPFISANYKGFYKNRRLEKQKCFFINNAKAAIDQKNYKISWDHQMTFTLMSHNMYGIAPKTNLIKNIGVDAETTHGGSSMRNVMTRRFCGMGSKPLEFPLVHPPVVLEDKRYERIVGNIICIPRYYFAGIKLARRLRKIFKSTKGKSYSQMIFSSKGGGKK
ncbi:MAG: glycosyltransferase family 2 protein [Clostridia bacterium]|nr:glycosyltransferase family 2 protein [Clostridia bacterium]